MAVPKNLKEKMLNAFTALNTIKDLNTKDDNLSSSLPSASKNSEYNTISYQLGKTLIDAKKDIPSFIKTPKKLYTLYLEGQRRKTENNFNNKSVGLIEENHKKLSDTFKYKKIDDFHDVCPNIIINEFKDLQETFGINSGKSIHILNKNKIFFDPEEGIPIYTSAKNFSNIHPEMHEGISLGFFIEKSKSIEVVVIISFFDEISKDRTGFNMLPINRNINVSIPNRSGYFKLGLKIVGEGFIEYKNITLTGLSNKTQKGLPNKVSHLKDGISILIPSYKGENTIIETLNSIVKQKSMSFDLIEVIIVINGEKDSTEDLVLDFSSKHDYLNLNCTYISSPGASRARNLAISKSTREFTVFCDDDDLLSEEYIAGLYEIRNLDSIGFCQIHDLEKDGSLIEENTINKLLLSTINDEVQDINKFTSAITMIASKIIPTKNIQEMSFNENLRSGEDVAFFTEYYVKYNPKLTMSYNASTYYIRRLRDNSVSRQELSFDFNISQRLDVMKDLLVLKSTIANQSNCNFIDSKIRAQCGFIVKYLNQYPEDYQKLHLQIISRGIQKFPYRYLQDQLGLVEPDLLVVSYCHPPFIDTSAVVSAKRVFEFNQICDVICADMSKVRDINTELFSINQHLVRDSFVVDTPTTFGGWEGISHFCKAVTTLSEDKKYKTIYSRSFWPASHFAAFEYKRKHPDVKWIAEFSDPVVFDIEGNTRYADISKEWVEEVVMDLNLSNFLKEEHNLYIWCELIVYLLSDEIIFTCENQKRIMLDKFPHQKNIIEIKTKSQIIPHPTLPKEYYESKKSTYKFDSSKINMAYFGAFYKTRRLEDLVEVISYYESNKLNYKNLKTPIVHIFTEEIASAEEMVKQEGLENYFIINSYINYFEFLSISRNMDILIVNDSKAKNIFGYNPYLPSKISDYSGAHTAIWAFVEKNSALSKISKINYSSELGNSKNAIEVLDCILNDFK